MPGFCSPGTAGLIDFLFPAQYRTVGYVSSVGKYDDTSVMVTSPYRCSGLFHITDYFSQLSYWQMMAPDLSRYSGASGCCQKITKATMTVNTKKNRVISLY
jgi:hypothetical protein